MGQHSLGGLFRHMGGKKMRGEGWPERGVQRDSVPAASPTGPSNQSALHQRWELAFSGKKASWDGDSNMLPGQDFTTRREWETHWEHFKQWKGKFSRVDWKLLNKIFRRRCILIIFPGQKRSRFFSLLSSTLFEHCQMYSALIPAKDGDVTKAQMMCTFVCVSAIERWSKISRIWRVM